MFKALIATDTAGCREVIRDGGKRLISPARETAPTWPINGKILPADSGGKKTDGHRRTQPDHPYFTKEIVFGIYLDKINRLSRNHPFHLKTPSHPNRVTYAPPLIHIL